MGACYAAREFIFHLKGSKNRSEVFDSVNRKNRLGLEEQQNYTSDGKV
jgi:hypothetical protein